MRKWFIFLVFTFIIFIPKDVYAISNDSWYKSFNDQSTSVIYRGCTSSNNSSCTNNNTVSQQTVQFLLDSSTSGEVVYKDVFKVSNVGFDSTGHIWTVALNQKLKQNYLYNVRMYICSSSTSFNSSFSYSFMVGLNDTDYREPYDYWYNHASLSSPAVDPYFGTYARCHLLSALVVPNTTGEFVHLRLRNTGSTFTETEYLISTEIESMGVFSYDTISNTITSAIQNSGFATASSVSAIQNSVNQVKTEVNGMQQEQQQTNQKLDDVNNSLNNESAPTNNDVSGKASEWSSKNASTGPISGMVLMPITLLNAYTNGMSSTCSPYNLGNLMGTDIILPCINVSNYLGSTLWGVIDVLFSGFMIYAMGKKFVKIFNDFTNLRDNQVDELYGGGN